VIANILKRKPNRKEIDEIPRIVSKLFEEVANKLEKRILLYVLGLSEEMQDRNYKTTNTDEGKDNIQPENPLCKFCTCYRCLIN